MITLGIIGVVAALTIPSLISNYRKHAVVNKLKTDISLIQNALKMAETKHGLANEWSFPAECLNNAHTGECAGYIFDTYFEPELHVIKKCYPVSDECWTPAQSLDGTKGYLQLVDTSDAVILKNGSALYFWSGGSVSGDNLHMQLWIDIDGPKKGKNMLGADIFGLFLNFSHYRTLVVVPGGTDIEDIMDAQNGCSKDIKGVHAGRYCAGLIQYNGWKIPDDYPIKF